MVRTPADQHSRIGKLERGWRSARSRLDIARDLGDCIRIFQLHGCESEREYAEQSVKDLITDSIKIRTEQNPIALL